MRETVKNVVFCLMFMGFMWLMAMAINYGKDVHFEHVVDRAEHSEETYVVGYGVYEDGLILEDDGNLWIYMNEKPFAEGTRVEMIFDTKGLSDKTKWDLIGRITVNQKVRI